MEQDHRLKVAGSGLIDRLLSSGKGDSVRGSHVPSMSSADSIAGVEQIRDDLDFDTIFDDDAKVRLAPWRVSFCWVGHGLKWRRLTSAGDGKVNIPRTSGAGESPVRAEHWRGSRMGSARCDFQARDKGRQFTSFPLLRLVLHDLWRMCFCASPSASHLSLPSRPTAAASWIILCPGPLQVQEARACPDYSRAPCTQWTTLREHCLPVHDPLAHLLDTR